MPGEDNSEALERLRKLKEDSSERYLNGLLNFFKWTTTFAFAVIIWIGTNSQNQYYNSFLMLLSIVFILLSIIIAIVTTHFILDFWNKDWQLKFHLHQFLTAFEMNNKFPCELTKEEYAKRKDQFFEYSGQFSELKRFDIYLIFHIIVLFIGIIFYLCAIFL